MTLSEPHGGRLVNRVVEPGDRDRRLRQAQSLPVLELSDPQAADVLNIATGAYSPLDGFMTRRRLDAVASKGRLEDGTPWTIPIVYPGSVPAGASQAALRWKGRIVGVLRVEDQFEPDLRPLARAVYGTDDAKHPGVAETLAWPRSLIGGAIDVFDPPALPFPERTLTPAQTRARFSELGWKTVVGFQTRNIPHLGHEYVQKTALTFVDGLFINPVAGRKKAGDFRDEVIVATYERLLRDFYPDRRATLAILHTEMRYAGPREAVFHAVVRKNFGCTHFVVGRDHAGVGTTYAPYAAHEIFAQYPDLGISPMFFTSFYFCTACGSVVNDKICPHGPESRKEYSGSNVRRALAGNAADVEWMIRPGVLDVVRSLGDPFVA